jgi:hypothetical protein
VKYNYYDFKKTKAELPADINAPVEREITRLFGSAELDAELVACRMKHRHCEVRFSIPEKNISCEIEFVNGIVPKYFLTGRKPSKGSFIEIRRSVNNDNLIYPKNAKREKE